MHGQLAPYARAVKIPLSLSELRAVLHHGTHVGITKQLFDCLSGVFGSDSVHFLRYILKSHSSSVKLNFFGSKNRVSSPLCRVCVGNVKAERITKGEVFPFVASRIGCVGNLIRQNHSGTRRNEMFYKVVDEKVDHLLLFFRK